MAAERRWQAFVNVSASGLRSDYPVRNDLPHPVDTYPKAMAQLRHTTADVDYLSRWWRDETFYPPLLGETATERRDANYSELVEAFGKARDWLAQMARENPDFDGGGLVFSFSGHGRHGDGTLHLRDSTFFSADDFLAEVSAAHQATGSDCPTRIVLLLDSCYSGAFLVRVLYRVANEPELGLDLEYILASCHPDEVSWESAAVGHGLSTFCFSLRTASIGSDIATAGLSGIKTWSPFTGPEGCSVATAAAQNPIVYSRGLSTCFSHLEGVWQSEEHLRELLKSARDDLYDRFAPFRTRQKSDLSDQDIDRSIAEELELVNRGERDTSPEERAETLRAYRRAWWLYPPHEST